MGFGVSFRLAPGERLRASARGVRASVGPRAARVHVGAGQTRISTGAGPVTFSAPVGGGRPRSTTRTPVQASSRTPALPRPRQPTVAQLQAQARAAERAQQVANVATLDRALTTLHHASFPDSTRQVLPDLVIPGPAVVDSVRRELYRLATAEVPVWSRAKRRQAKAWAQLQAPNEAERRHAGERVITQLEQLRLDTAWEGRSQPVG